jgi:obg-like ATPase 1
VRAVDGIFQVVRAFDDAEVIHVEGDVDPLRDMEIIQNELRLKDIEWVQKQIDGLKKTGRSLGSNSLADKARKEEIVSASLRGWSALEITTFSGHRRESTQVSERR